MEKLRVSLAFGMGLALALTVFGASALQAADPPSPAQLYEQVRAAAAAGDRRAADLKEDLDRYLIENHLTPADLSVPVWSSSTNRSPTRRIRFAHSWRDTLRRR